MKKIFILIVFIYLLVSCSTDVTINNNGNSKLYFSTPSSIDKLNINFSSELTNYKLNESNLKYEIIINFSNGLNFTKFILKSNEEKLIEVPANNSFDIYCGVFESESANTNNEKYNFYFASDIIKNVFVSEGETKELLLNLDLKEEKKVNNFIFDNFAGYSLSNINSIVLSKENNPVFSINVLNNNVSKFLKYQNNSFIDITNQLGFNFSGKGNIFSVTSEPTEENWFFVGDNGYYVSKYGDKDYIKSIKINLSTYLDKLKNINKIENIFVNDINLDFPRYYYLFNYGNSGALSFAYGVESPYDRWSKVTDIKYSDFPEIYENKPFILDIEQFGYGTGNGLLATTKGLYYIDEEIIKSLSPFENPNKILDKLTKKILIKDKDNKEVLVTNIKIVNNNIFLATLKGLIKIDKDLKINDFINSKSSTQIEYKFNNFDLQEEIDFIEKIKVNNNNILFVSTPNKILFKNLTLNKDIILTVWDGLPFIPGKIYNNLELYDKNYFTVHSIAKVKNVISDEKNKLIWIGTNFGLASIKSNLIY